MKIKHIEYWGDCFPDYEITLTKKELKELERDGKIKGKSGGCGVTVKVTK